MNTMKLLATVLFIFTLACRVLAGDTAYSTEATILPGKAKDQYLVQVRVSQMVEHAGQTEEKLISAPRVLATLGQKASCFVGSDDPKMETVAVVVFCPKNGAAEFATCTVTVKQGTRVVSKSVAKFKIGGE